MVVASLLEMARVTVSPCPRALRSRITVTALGLAAGFACLSVVVYGCSREAAGTPFTPAAPGDDGSTGDEQVNLAPPPSLTTEGGASDDAGAVFTGPLAGPFRDFPAAPVLDEPDGGDGGSAPSNSATLFGAPSQGAQSGGPCLIEPEPNSLYPNNWLRPRFTWIPVGGENLFELRVHAANQANDLVLETPDTSYTMPADLWDALRAHSQDVAMTVSIRGGQLSGSALEGEALGSTGPIGIAPAAAPGTIVYWAIVDPNAPFGTLKGFSVGDESVESVLAPSQVAERAPETATCIGCHTSTPDGLNVAFSIGPNPDWPYTNSIGTIGVDASPGLTPAFLTPDGKSALDSHKGIAAFSRAHWTTGDRVALLSDDDGGFDWVDLDGVGAQATGTLARTGTDNGGAISPTWSHDGTTVAYTSLPVAGIEDGRPNTGPMDLYTMPYASRAGGAQAAVQGASDNSVNEYYPSFSPDDRYLVFNRCPVGESSYNNADGEIYLVPAGGGTATRLAANDPPACMGEHSPGVTNSWAKWAPSAQSVPVLGLTYYWVVFSSTRSPGAIPQLFITAVVVDGQGNMTTYGSLYLWNQPSQEHNHTPAWDVFQIPPPPGVPR
jgi:WD40-like Beta Propeller Repeat